MISKTTIPLILGAFLLGAVVSYGVLKKEIDEIKTAMLELTQQVQSNIENADSFRTVDDVRKTNDSLGYLVAMEKDGAPLSFVADQMATVLNKKMLVLESKLDQISSQKLKEDALAQLREGEELLKETEFYFRLNPKR